MKERIFLDSAGKRLPSPPDNDSFLQCWTCSSVVQTRDIMKQGKISGISGIEPVSNPYDEKKGVILGNDSRLSSRIKKLKQRKNKHPDKYVQAELDKGNIVTNYQTDAYLIDYGR